MATNPMQRRSRNSFLLGMLVMLLIAGVIAGVTVYMLVTEMTKLKKNQDKTETVYALSTSVKSGEIITDDMFQTMDIVSTAIPSNAISYETGISEFMLKDKKTGSHIMHINAKERVDASSTAEIDVNYMYLTENNNYVLIDYDAETDAYYRYKANNSDILIGQDVANQQISTYLYIDAGQNNQLRLTKIGSSIYYNNTAVSLSKEKVEFANQPIVAKVNLEANTIVTYDMVIESDEFSSDDLRIQEYSMFSLPVKLNIGDFIDVRLTLPNGLDYIVVSKKKVIDVLDTTIWIKVSEQEILTLSNAIVEAYMMTGAKLTVNLFVEPGMQKAATPTYAVSAEVYKLIQSDPNIVQRAKDELKYRFSSSGDNLESQRVNEINGQINKYVDEAQENVNQKVQEEVDARKEMRQKYIEQLLDASTIVEE